MIRLLVNFLKDWYSSRFIFGQLVKRDLQNRYIGSAFGVFWYVAQPLVMLLILWFVLEKIFKASAITPQIPFIAWLVVGMIVWNYFVEAISSATGVFPEFSYMVKKVNFRVAQLPLVKIVSALITHFVFVLIAIVILLVSGIDFSWFWLQALYYLFSLTILLTGLSWLLSSLNVFIRDTAYFITVALQFLYWLSPIFWNFQLLPDTYQVIFKLNPLYYIVEGYRDSFLYEVAFWNHWQLTVYFWGVTLGVLFIGSYVFRKLRPHLADSL